MFARAGIEIVSPWLGIIERCTVATSELFLLSCTLCKLVHVRALVYSRTKVLVEHFWLNTMHAHSNIRAFICTVLNHVETDIPVSNQFRSLYTTCNQLVKK